MWTYGLVSISGDKKQLSIKKLTFNPGVAGVIIALILFVCKINLPYIISQPIEYLSDLNTPLPMLVIGFYLSQANFKKAFTDLGTYVAMAVRLVAIPVAAAVVMAMCGIDKTIIVAFIIASSAPTAATTTMFAAKYNRDVELSVSTVTATTIVSIVTMSLVVAFSQIL